MGEVESAREPCLTPREEGARQLQEGRGSPSRLPAFLTRRCALGLALAAALLALAGLQVLRPGLRGSGPPRFAAGGGGGVLGEWNVPGTQKGNTVPSEMVCGLDLYQMAAFLGLTGASVKQAMDDCKDLTTSVQDAYRRAQCSFRVNTVISTLVSAGADISGAASACASTINGKAACATVSQLMVAAVSLMAAMGSDMVNCMDYWWRSTPVPPNGVTTPRPVPTLTLPSLPTLPPPPKLLPPALQEVNAIAEQQSEAYSEYAVTMTKCWAAVSQVVSFMIRGGIQINHAVEHCPPEAWVTYIPHRKCTVDVLSILSTFFGIASFLSVSVVDCVGVPQVYDQDIRRSAKCAADVTGMVSAITLASAVGLDFTLACNPNITGEAHGPLPQIQARRLVDGRRPAASRAQRAEWLELLRRKGNASEGIALLMEWVQHLPEVEEGEGER